MKRDFNKSRTLEKRSRTATSYDEVFMDLFMPSGGQTKNWYVRTYVASDLKAHYGKTTELRQSTKTTDEVMAMARTGVFVTAKAREFLPKRALIARQQITIPLPE